MEIRPNNQPIDPASRRRNVDVQAAKTSKITEESAVPAPTPDAVAPSTEELMSYVDALKSMAPASNAPRIEAIQQQIASGEYTADVSNMVDAILKLLGKDGSAA